MKILRLFLISVKSEWNLDLTRETENKFKEPPTERRDDLEKTNEVIEKRE